MFFSSVIVERHEPNVVETQDGITVMFHGLINASRTSQNGFSSEVGYPFSFSLLLILLQARLIALASNRVDFEYNQCVWFCCESFDII